MSASRWTTGTLILISVSVSGRTQFKQVTPPASRMNSSQDSVTVPVLKISAAMMSSSWTCSREVSSHWAWSSPGWGGQNLACIDLRVFTDEGIAGILPLGICQDRYLRERYCVPAVETLACVNSIWTKIPKYSGVTFSLKGEKTTQMEIPKSKKLITILKIC